MNCAAGSVQQVGADTVLVINCGSSSVKYQLVSVHTQQVLAGGLFERIGEPSSRLHHRLADAEDVIRLVAARDHREALKHIAAVLGEGDAPLALAAVGHRVVHGGERFQAPALVDAEVLRTIRELSPLAPLHNPVNLIGIEVMQELLPKVAQVAVFDTAFHQSMPQCAARYAVAQSWYRQHGVRRYGFHGTSHEYVAERAAQHMQRPLARLKLITLHLGNGASAAAISGGHSIDTSMGLTPLEGLVMGTRSGDLDPAIVAYMQRVAGLDAQRVDHDLNHDSGLKGLCGSNDMREVLARAAAADEAARLALDVYCYRIKKYIGAYLAALGGLDALVFTGGIGENAAAVRGQIASGLEVLGIAVDASRNRAARGPVAEIQPEQGAIKVLVIRTNEELHIARQALQAVQRCGDGGR
jgi:acetate kinase